MEQGQEKIGKATRYLMIGTAMFVDLAQLSFLLIEGFLPGIVTAVFAGINTIIILPCVALLYYMWFKANGVGWFERFLGTKARTGGKAGAQMMLKKLFLVLSIGAEPVISFWPGWTIMIVVTLSTLKGEHALVASGLITEEELQELFSVAQAGGDLKQVRAFLALKAKREAIAQIEAKALEQHARIAQARKIRAGLREAEHVSREVVRQAQVIRDIRRKREEPVVA